MESSRVIIVRQLNIVSRRQQGFLWELVRVDYLSLFREYRLQFVLRDCVVVFILWFWCGFCMESCLYVVCVLFNRCKFLVVICYFVQFYLIVLRGFFFFYKCVWFLRFRSILGTRKGKFSICIQVGLVSDIVQFFYIYVCIYKCIFWKDILKEN